ncbi:MAG: ABC transporter ATP-binding protein [Bacilli bacterium]
MCAILKVENVTYAYDRANPILFDVTATFERGKMYSIIGPSGSGKTTLLSILSGLDVPQSGTMLYDDREIKGRDLTRYRSRHIAIVFQNFNLLPYMTALQNVTTAMEIRKMKGSSVQRAVTLLHEVGLTESQMKQPILTLSGGQQQRVAIARALACGANIIFADEPTGNLDAKTAADIMTLFHRIAKEENKCVIIVTHDLKVSDACNGALTIDEGKLVRIR